MDEARELHETMTAAFSALVARLDGSRVETRAGHLFFVCPPAAAIPGANGVWADEDEATAAALARSLRELEELGLPFWVQTREGRHPGAEAEARRLGLVQVESEPGMVAAADDLAALPETDLDIRRVADDAGLRHAVDLAAVGFGVPKEVMAPVYSRAVASMPGLSTYVGYADGAPVCTAVGVVVRGNVGIFNVATPPEHRRRGYGAALTARAIRDGMEAGARLAALQASADGEPVYRRMGFRSVERYRLFGRA